MTGLQAAACGCSMKKGKEFLAGNGTEKELVSKLEMIGISGIGNILSAIKTARTLK
jgi:hypothetical protein